MFFRPKFVPLKIAVRALLVSVCVSVAVGNAVRVLLPALLSADVLVANEAPAQQSSLPEEAPQESPSSNEPTKDGEVLSFSLRRKSHKASRFPVQLVNVADLAVCQMLSAQAQFDGSQMPVPQFEHRYRNGCGAHLRC